MRALLARPSQRHKAHIDTRFVCRFDRSRAHRQVTKATNIAEKLHNTCDGRNKVQKFMVIRMRCKGRIRRVAGRSNSRRYGDNRLSRREDHCQDGPSVGNDRHPKEHGQSKSNTSDRDRKFPRWRQQLQRKSRARSSRL